MYIGKNRLALLATCTLALFAAPAAFAGHGDNEFKMMDTNKDGKISRAEHSAGAKLMFTQADANHDGKVTAAEMDAALAARGEKPSNHEKSSAEMIKVIDQNGDGELTAAEHESGSEKMFALLDKDNDGFVSKAESEEGHKMMKKDK